jgi:hypothetical protein
VENRELRESSAKAARISDPATYPVVVVPAQVLPVGELPLDRRTAFQESLVKLVKEALAGATAPDGVHPNPHWRSWSVKSGAKPVLEGSLGTLLETACAVCGGECCTNGGNQGLLRAADIRRYAAALPNADAECILDAYLSRVGDQTYVDSCIYHGPSGCYLPREMRSRICTDFTCTAFETLKRRVRYSGVGRYFIIAKAGTQPVRWAFFNEGIVTACSGDRH